MPIVDGLTSTKMIRSFEKTHTNIYSPRAKLCGRIPIIAVSASLNEKDRQHYIDAGFDAWILKPIPFDRMNKLIAAIVDDKIRSECLYEPGQWERGGWFHAGEKSSDEAFTRPSGEIVMSAPSAEAQEAAKSDDPSAGEEVSTDKRDVEQARLLQNQEQGKTEAPPEESAEQSPEETAEQPSEENAEQAPPEKGAEQPPTRETTEQPPPDETAEQAPT
jgi:DNA-binding response OmpR family regulator